MALSQLLILFMACTIGPISSQVHSHNRLYVGNKLYPGFQLVSPNGAYTLLMQTDGNLVVYDRSNHPTWATVTDGEPIKYLILQEDGNLVLYKTDGGAAWETQTYPQPYASHQHVSHLEMQDDGLLVLYCSYDLPLWTSTDGKHRDSCGCPAS